MEKLIRKIHDTLGWSWWLSNSIYLFLGKIIWTNLQELMLFHLTGEHISLILSSLADYLTWFLKFHYYDYLSYFFGNILTCLEHHRLFSLKVSYKFQFFFIWVIRQVMNIFLFYNCRISILFLTTITKLIIAFLNNAIVILIDWKSKSAVHKLFLHLSEFLWIVPIDFLNKW